MDNIKQASPNAETNVPFSRPPPPLNFYTRSDAELDSNLGFRQPLNYATAYLDLDFVYGRSKAEAEALRTLEGGLMTLATDGLPVQNNDNTWLVSSIALQKRKHAQKVVADAHNNSMPLIY